MKIQARDIKGYYKILGLQPNATTADINEAYIQKHTEFHPASVPRQRMRQSKEFMEMSEEKKRYIETQLDEQAIKIYEAYSVLSYGTRRWQYDNETGEFAPKPSAFEVIFSALFTCSPKVEQTCPALEIAICLIDIFSTCQNRRR